MWLAHVSAALPGARVTASAWVVTCGAVGVLVLALSRPARRLFPVGAALALAVAALVAGWSGSPGPGLDHLRVSFLDVGQGDATLLQDGRAALLVDAGPADGEIVRRLRQAGVRRLDALVLTHAQADHIGGAASVLRAVPVDLVIDGEDGVRSPDGDRVAAELARRDIRRVVPAAGQVLRVGRLELRVLSPAREPAAAHAGQDPNVRAIVGLVRGSGVTVLLTADAESDVLAPLDLSAVDVLKVSHHGSADPGLAALLTRLRPRVAVIEVGAHNAYGHPAPETVAELTRANAAVYRTDRDGTIRLDAVRGHISMRTDT
jgi:competence protein ComEC